MYEKEEQVAIHDKKFVRWTNDNGWVSCRSFHPDATPDLNYGAAKVSKHCKQNE